MLRIEEQWTVGYSSFIPCAISLAFAYECKHTVNTMLAAYSVKGQSYRLTAFNPMLQLQLQAAWLGGNSVHLGSLVNVSTQLRHPT